MTTLTSPTVQPGHIGINVTDLGRSVDFYTAVLGLSMMGRSDDEGRRYAFLGVDSTLLVTLWEQSNGVFDAASPGLHHLSFQVSDLEQVRLAETRLRALGAAFVYDGVVAHGEGATSGGIYFTDPDGVRLEIFAPLASGEAEPATPGAPSCGFF